MLAQKILGGLGLALVLGLIALSVMFARTYHDNEAHGRGLDAMAAMTSKTVTFTDVDMDWKPLPHPKATPDPWDRFHPRVNKVVGRIVIDRLDLNVRMRQGTAAKQLDQGPSHYLQSFWPGAGKVVAVAAHRTTIGAWFYDIDKMERGDLVTLKMPYGDFTYRVTGHEIVDANDWTILRGKGEFLVLSACHPKGSAEKRYVVYARPVR